MTNETPNTAGTVHWVYSHPMPRSFNRRLFDGGVQALLEQDRRVITSDLYDQKFDPLLSERDLGQNSPALGGFIGAIEEAHLTGRAPVEVQEEQAKLAAADLLVLQFPLWWYGTPAMLKGWIDRVFTGPVSTAGMDAERGVPRRYGDGFLAGRRALIIVTAGEDDRTLGRRGVAGDLESLLFPLTHGVLWFVGIEALDLHVVYDSDDLREADVEREVKRLRTRLRNIDAEQARPYRTLRDGDYHGTRALEESILPERTDFGIHRVSP